MRRSFEATSGQLIEASVDAPATLGLPNVCWLVLFYIFLITLAGHTPDNNQAGSSLQPERNG